MKEEKIRKDHFGVYVLFLKNSEALLVHKTRGPYSGLMDLPGGSPEFGESPIETALREIKEELGLSLSRDQLRLDQAIGFTYENEEIVLFHKAVIFSFEGPPGGVSSTSLQSSDTQGSMWVPFDSQSLSPLALESLKSYQVGSATSWLQKNFFPCGTTKDAK